MKPFASSAPVLFGAFDRHNFGDLLFPHLMTALLPEQAFRFAGLAARDLQAFGGHRVSALAAQGDARPAHLIHVGGEVLTCSAWQAAVMLLDPVAAAAAIARYVNAVGGVEWASLTVAQRGEVKAALQQADWISVRDHRTRDALRGDGIDASLCPDPAVMVAECFGEVILKHQQQGAVKEIREAYPQGYLACQFSADFGDDASLEALAQGLSRVSAGTGLGLVCFRAGAAPWHDDPALYEALQRRLPPGSMRCFPSLHLWDICALIAASRGVVGSSLHGRIVALAYGLPRVSLIPPQQGRRPDKRAAFAETWEPDAVPRSVTLGQIEPAVRQALAVPAGALLENAADLRERYRQSQAQWISLLNP
jgi:hypothetical protein